jgi:hypothetical protein
MTSPRAAARVQGQHALDHSSNSTVLHVTERCKGLKESPTARAAARMQGPNANQFNSVRSQFLHVPKHYLTAERKHSSPRW